MLKIKNENLVWTLFILVATLLISLTLGVLFPVSADVSTNYVIFAGIIISIFSIQIIYSKLNMLQTILLVITSCTILFLLLAADNFLSYLISGTKIAFFPKEISLSKAGIDFLAAILNTKLLLETNIISNQVIFEKAVVIEPDLAAGIQREKNIKAEINFTMPTDKLLSSKFQREISDEGKITIIDKLLANKRDIENIIETNALLQHLESVNDKITLISNQKGIKLKNILKKNFETEKILEIGLIDKAGRFIAQDCEQKTLLQNGEELIFLYNFTIQNGSKTIENKQNSSVIFVTNSKELCISQMKNHYIYMIFQKNGNLNKENAIGNAISKDFLKPFFNNMNIFMQKLNFDSLKKVTIFTENEKLIMIANDDEYYCYKNSDKSQDKIFNLIDTLKEELLQEIA